MRRLVTTAALATLLFWESSVAAEYYSVSEDGDVENGVQKYICYIGGGAAQHLYTCTVNVGTFHMGGWVQHDVYAFVDFEEQYSGPPAYTYMGDRGTTEVEAGSVWYQFNFNKNGAHATTIYKQPSP